MTQTDDARGCRIAVIVPCFNDGATLPETLASIAEPEPVEVVVIDDGSDDVNTLELFRQLEADGVRIVHQQNAGLSAARMTGLAATTAPYVSALDADDRSASGALSALADALDADPRAGVAWGTIQEFGEKRVRQPLGDTLDPWLITYVNMLPSDALIRREALLDVGGWKLENGYEDWELWMSLAERGWRGVQVPRLQSFYRVRSTRMLADAQKLHDDICRDIRNRHRDLFARRPANRRESNAPWRCKVLFPLVQLLPVSGWTRHRLSRLIYQPSVPLKVRLDRVLRRRRARRSPSR